MLYPYSRLAQHRLYPQTMVGALPDVIQRPSPSQAAQAAQFVQSAIPLMGFEQLLIQSAWNNKRMLGALIGIWSRALRAPQARDQDIYWAGSPPYHQVLTELMFRYNQLPSEPRPPGNP